MSVWCQCWIISRKLFRNQWDWPPTSWYRQPKAALSESYLFCLLDWVANQIGYWNSRAGNSRSREPREWIQCRFTVMWALEILRITWSIVLHSFSSTPAMWRGTQLCTRVGNQPSYPALRLNTFSNHANALLTWLKLYKSSSAKEVSYQYSDDC